MMRFLKISALLCMGIMVIGCSGGRHLAPPMHHVYPDSMAIAQPKERKTSLLKEAFNKTFDYQLKQMLDFPRVARKATDNPYEALNIDNFDEVPNSSWFTNRNGKASMTLYTIRRGPNRSNGPDTSGVWTIVRGKMAGVTPGFTIKDNRGDAYIIKFDPADYPELPSGAEVVTARLFYAAGYNVPENYLAYLRPDRLVIDPDATLTVETGDKRPALETRRMTDADLTAIFQQTNPTGQPVVRVAASQFLKGIPIGPWPYTGVRKDDLNDRYPHPHRRELRGLYVISAWLNHADMKEENTLDVYDPQKRYVKHFLIDFGASLGSNSRGPSVPRRGHANGFDLKQSMVHLMTLGLYVYDYEQASPEVQYPSLGYLNNDLFHPNGWKPIYPAPPFENLTKRDAFWGAKIVTSFTNAQIESAVSEGAYSDPGADAHLAEWLQERRDIIGRYWFSRVNTLDRFEITEGMHLHGVDLAVSRGYANAEETRYQIEVLTPDGKALWKEEVRTPVVTLDSQWRGHRRLVVSLLPQRPGYKVKPLRVYLTSATGGWQITGLHRAD